MNHSLGCNVEHGVRCQIPVRPFQAPMAASAIADNFLLLGEPASAARVAFLAAIVVGVIGLRTVEG